MRQCLPAEKTLHGVQARKRRERGFTLITMALASVALVGVLGLSVDLGRLFIAKNETQQYVDAAALAAALQLDGTSTGISSAKSAVTNSANRWNFGSSTISSPTVQFATTSSGTWSNTPATPTDYAYVQVTATVSAPLYFLPLIVSSTSQSLVSTAIAGQVSLTTIPQGLAPFTAVSTNNTAPSFGLTVGDEYDLQWPQFNGSRNGCSTNAPDNCFTPGSAPCMNDSKASKSAVVQYWSSANNGYWGSNSNSTIAQEVLDVIQLQAVAVGTNIQPVLSNGNKASEAGYLDDRASEDVDVTDNTLSAYLAATHNGRRLILFRS